MAALFLYSPETGELLLERIFAPESAMVHGPVHECFFKANIMPCFFALNPFIAQNFLPLSDELFVER